MRHSESIFQTWSLSDIKNSTKCSRRHVKPKSTKVSHSHNSKAYNTEQAQRQKGTFLKWNQIIFKTRSCNEPPATTSSQTGTHRDHLPLAPAWVLRSKARATANRRKEIVNQKILSYKAADDTFQHNIMYGTYTWKWSAWIHMYAWVDSSAWG